MTTTIVLAILFVLLAFAVVRANAPVDGRVSPLVIGAFAIFLYVVTVPVELAIRGQSMIGTTRFYLPPAVGEQIVLLAILSLLAAAVAYSVVARPGSALPTVGNAQAAGRVAASALLVSLAGATLMATFYRGNVAAAADYLANVAQTSSGGSDMYFLLNRWTYLSYAMFCFLSLAASDRQWRRLPLLLPLVAWSIYSNDKDPLLVAALAATGLSFRSTVARPWHGWRGLVVGFVVLVPVVAFTTAAYGTSRSGEDVTAGSMHELVENGLFVSIDPAGPTGVLATEVQRPEGAGSFDATISGAFMWLPSRLRPTDPVEDLGVAFAKSYWPGWQPGFGFGYSPVAEGYQADGALGVALLFAVLGSLLGLSRRVLIRDQRTRSPDTIALGTAVFFVVVGYLSFVVMRGSFSTIVTTGVVCSGLVVVTFLVHRLLPSDLRSP